MKPRVFLRGDGLPPEQRRLVTHSARATLEDQGVSRGHLAIVLADRERMQDLNREYAGQDSPTDVLSFTDGSLDPQSGQPYLGDVVICGPVALEQAATAGHSPESELALLAVHGVLHLLGHDHGQAAERAKMWEAQQRILSGLGLALLPDWGMA
jgi:probable rRNA maturation factor